MAPRWLFLALAAARDAQSQLAGRELEITRDMARVLASSYEARSSKAERELGYESVPFRQMVQDTFEWMRAEHLV